MRNLIIIAIALLVSASPINTGRFETVSGVVAEIKYLGRPLTYGILFSLLIPSILYLITRRKIQAPSVSIFSYAAIYGLISLKMIAYGHTSTAALYAGALFLYLAIFGSWLPNKNLGFNLKSAVKSIGISNIIITTTNAPFAITNLSSLLNERLFGLTFNPNILAYSCALTFCCIPAATESLKKSKNIIILLFFALNFLLVVSTLSRGGIIILSLSSLSVAYQLTGRYRKLIIPGILSFTLVALFTITNNPLTQKIFANRENTRGWVIERQLGRFWNDPIFGGSWENSRIIFGENLYFGTLSETGVIGFVFLSVFFIALLLRLNKKQQSQLRSAEAFMARSFVMLVLASGLLESLLLGVINPAIFAILAIDAGSRNPNRRPKK